MSLRVRLSRGTIIDFKSPQVLADGLRWLVVGESGSGKSSCVASIAAQVIAGGEQVVVLDPHAEYADLWSVDPAVVVRVGYGGQCVEEDDIPQLLDLITSGSSVLLDLSHWMLHPQEMDAFVLTFVRALFDLRIKHPRFTLLVVEEAQTFAPQAQMQGQNNNVLTWVQLLTAGRKYGLGVVLASQRISLVDSNVVSNCNARVFLRLSEVRDWKRARQYIPEEMGMTYETLRHFRSGEALILTRWTPESRVQLLLPGTQMRKAAL